MVTWKANNMILVKRDLENNCSISIGQNTCLRPMQLPLTRAWHIRMQMLLTLVLFVSASYCAVSIELQESIQENEIFLSGGISRQDLMQDPSLIKTAVESFPRKPLGNYLNQVTNLSKFLFFDRYANCLVQQNPQKCISDLFELQFDTCKTTPTYQLVQTLQLGAFALKKHKVIPIIYDNFFKYYALRNEWNRQNLNSSSPEPSILSPPGPDCLKQAQNFIEDFKARRGVHDELMEQLFPVFKNLDDALQYALKQVYEKIALSKTNLNVLKTQSSTKSLEQQQRRFELAVKVRISHGQSVSLLHDFRKIFLTVDKPMKAALVGRLIACLHTDMRDENMSLPSELQSLVPKAKKTNFLEWMYVKFNVFTFLCASQRPQVLAGSQKRFEEHLNTQDSYNFLLTNRIIWALRPFADTFTMNNMPCVIYDVESDPDFLRAMIITNCMNSNLSYYMNLLERNTKVIGTRQVNDKTVPVVEQTLLTQKQVSTFYTAKLPDAFNACVKQCEAYSFMEYLDTSCFDLPATKVSKVGTPKKTGKKPEEAVMNFDPVPEGETELVDSDDEAAPALKFVEPVENPDEVQEVTRKPIDFDELLRPQTVSLHYDQDEAEKAILIHKQDLERFQALNQLPSLEVNPRVCPFNAKVISRPQSFGAKNQFVIRWGLNTFLELFPFANNVFRVNIDNSIPQVACKDKSLKFRWAFDSQKVVSQESFVFLCQLYGFLPGKKLLKFSQFLKVFREFDGDSAASALSGKNPVKNRTVFQFKHCFLVDGMTCIPPIRGVHPEHESSRFNHKQVRRFFEYAGVHPLFFVCLQFMDLYEFE